MKPCILLMALAAVSLAAGCASAPQEEAVSFVTPSDTGNAAAVQAPPAAVVNLNEAPGESSRNTVICRQMLRKASNVIEEYCMTIDDWKTYERAEARHAQELVRIMQGSAYR